MKQTMKQILSFMLAAAVLLCTFPATSIAAPAVVSETIDFTYHFNAGVTENTDQVTWRDDCFTRSSFLGCCHLAEVSAAAALASTPYYNSAMTPTQNEPLAPKYIKEFLSLAHFRDVETNTYYTTRAAENSVGAAFGHKTIQDGDKNYTLLAIVIRSAGYTQEWTGNLNILDETGGPESKIHAGFKAARDEALRYAAQYMKAHGITGDLKVWIAGHSRGAATSNSLGGFFAGGGDEYFRAMGIPVKVTPENVYCYTFSTPRPIRPGLTHAEDLSVAGNRDGYPNDTPGKPYTSTNTGTVNPSDNCYSGIRNYPKYHDVVPKLAPSIPGWNYTYYGRVCQYHSKDLEGGPVTESEMLQQLSAFDPAMYQSYVNGGSPDAYKRVTLDFDKLIEAVVSGEEISIAEVMKMADKGPLSMGEFMTRRVEALEIISKSPRVFKENEFQPALQAVAGLFGMVSLDMNDPNLNIGDLATAVVFWLLDYSMVRLREVRNDSEPVLIVNFLEKLLAYLLPNESIPDNSLCLTSIAQMAARYVFPQSGDTKLTDSVIELAVEYFPDPDDMTVTTQVIYTYLNTYLPRDKMPDEYTKAERLEAFLKACGWGPADNTRAKDEGETAEDTCSTLCIVLALAAAAGVMDLPDWLTDALATPNKPEAFPGQVLNLLESMMPEGEEYKNITIAADIWGRHAADSLYEGPLDALAGQGYSQEYIDDARRHFADLKTYIRPLRTVLMTFLLSTNGEPFTIENIIRNASLFAANDGLVGVSHYVQVDLAWAKARRAKGIWDHDYPGHDILPTEPGPTVRPVPHTGDSSHPFLWIGLVLLGFAGMGLLAARKVSRKRK